MNLEILIPIFRHWNVYTAARALLRLREVLGQELFGGPLFYLVEEMFCELLFTL